MATYERGAGDHIAERLRPVPGSDEEARLNALADDPSTDWRRIDDEPLTPVTPDPPTPVVVDPKAPARSASKSDWFVYAVSRGLGEDEADKLTRDQLVELFLDGGNP